MKDKIVKVEWEDASFTAGHYDEEKPQRFTPVSTSTIGYLIRKDRKMVILSQDRFYAKGKADGDRGIYTIPRKMITKITYLEGK